MADVLSDLLLAAKSNYALGIDNTLPVLRLHLYTNNVTPICTSDISDFDECAAPGYSPFDFIPGDWVQSIVSCDVTMTYPTVTFTFSGPGSPGETIYGHFVEDTGTGDLWWAGLWTTAYTIPPGGGEVQVNVTWTDKQCP